MIPEDGLIAEGTWNGERAEFRRDRLIVSVREGGDVAAVLREVAKIIAVETHAEPAVIRRPDAPWAVFAFPALPGAETQIPALAARLAARPDLLYAEPDFIGHGHYTPDDPLYPKQWWTRKIGIEDAWGVTTGDPDVLLAIVDSGISIPDGQVEPDHEDLCGSRFIVRHEIGGIPVDHDYVGDESVPKDAHGHGTHVAGIAAAAGNNGTGVAGVNWKSPIYVARVINAANNCTVSSVKLAVEDIVRYRGRTSGIVASHGSWMRTVINLSLGFKNYAGALQEMCRETSTGTIVLCVATRERLPADPSAPVVDIDYPAAFASQFHHVIAVGATDGDDRIVAPLLDDYRAVTIFAPGMQIVSTVPTYPCTWVPGAGPPVGKRYRAFSGTSQACPIVAGVVSLIWGVKPDATPAEIRQGLVDAAAPTAEFNGVRYPRLRVG